MYFAPVVNYMITDPFFTKSSAGALWMSNCWIFYLHYEVFALSLGHKVREGSLHYPWSQNTWDDCCEVTEHAFGFLNCGNSSVTYPINCILGKLSAGPKRGLLGLILGPMLFYIFLSKLAVGIESTNFAGNTSPGGEMNTAEGWPTLKGWESGGGRTTWSLTKASAKSCTWGDMTNEPSTHQVLRLGSSLAKGGWRSWWVTAQPESAGHICSNKGKADPELYPWSNTNRAATIPLCIQSTAQFWNHNSRKTQIDCPKEGHKGRQRAGEPSPHGEI